MTATVLSVLFHHEDERLSSDISVFGQIIFSKCKTETYPEGTEKPVMEEFESGTVLYDSRVSFLRNYGSLRHTIIHECVHWYIHKKTFLLAQQMKQAQIGIKCLMSGEIRSYEQSDDAWFLEWQANKIASKILVPEILLKEKTSDFLLSERLDNPGTADIYLFRGIIKKLAMFFKVSEQVIRIRLSECGYEIVNGVYDYCNGKLLQEYTYKESAIRNFETYSIPAEDLIIESMKNLQLNDLLKTCKFVYSDSHVVLNHPKFVYEDKENKKLTEYARMHMDECALKFTLDVRTDMGGKGFYRECILCRGFSQGLKPECKFDISANKDNISKAEAIITKGKNEIKLIKCVDEFSFANTLKNLQKECDIKVEELSEKSCISTRQIVRLRKEDDDYEDSDEKQADNQKEKTDELCKPELSTVIALAIGLNLPENVAFRFIAASGHNLVLGKKEHILYKFFISDYCWMDIHECNNMLIENHCKPMF